MKKKVTKKSTTKKNPVHPNGGIPIEQQPNEREQEFWKLDWLWDSLDRHVERKYGKVP
jgi:hypothetical protein